LIRIEQYARSVYFLKTVNNKTRPAKFINFPLSESRIAYSYMMEKYINPLLENSKLKMTISGKPKSRNQKYYSSS
jgi:hypothetical protein